jgi:GR25 family glycosyltransferase involved in LPS biosynthesis
MGASGAARFIGRYINVDSSVERRRAMEDQFARFGVADRYTRFSAVDGRSVDRPRSPLSPGEIGCFLSHYQCIKAARDQGAHVHVMEDDTVLCAHTVGFLDQILDGALEHYDMLFTDIFVPPDLAAVMNLMNLYRLTGALKAGSSGIPSVIHYADLAKLDFAATNSYVVNGRTADRLLALMEAELDRGPRIAVDMFYRAVVRAGAIRAVCTVPFLTSADPGVASTIRSDGARLNSALALFLLRASFFIGRDAAALREIGERINSGLEDPDCADTILQSFRFILSGRYVDV